MLNVGQIAKSVEIYMMLKLLIVIAGILLAAPKAQCIRLKYTPVKLPCSRLAINFKPIKYDIQLNLPKFDHPSVAPLYYSGRVNISFEYRSETRAKYWQSNVICAGNPKKIMLHADSSLDIDEIRVYSKVRSLIKGRRMKERNIKALQCDESKQMIIISLESPLSTKSESVISISFFGPIRRERRGIYLSQHEHDIWSYDQLVSQLEPGQARLAFPCFDEPHFKAPFSLRVLHPSSLRVYGNNEATLVIKDDEMGIKTTYFAITPEIYIHMLAFVVVTPDQIELEADLKSNRSNGVRKVRVITGGGTKKACKFALRVALHSLDWFEQYIDFNYPLRKLDLFAIAQLDRNNTGSLGLIFVPEHLLLVDNETGLDTKIRIAINLAQAVVRQWFGNLFAVGRWSDLWITEGIATQFAFQIVQELDPESNYLVRLDIMRSVMWNDRTDRMRSLSPEESELQTSEQIYEIFDQFESMKSASLAQMLSDAIGAERYKIVLRNLVSQRANKNIYFYDYKRALENIVSGPSFDHALDMLMTFAKFRGVPVLYVTEDHLGHLSLMLHKSIPSKDKLQDLVIFVNSSISGSEGAVNFSDRYLASSKRFGIDFPMSKQYNRSNFFKIDLNPSIRTYYRTCYKDNSFQRLISATKLKRIGPMDRLHILEDANALVWQGLMTWKDHSKLFESYINEDHGAVLLGLLAASQVIRLHKSWKASPAFWRLYQTHGFEVTGTESLVMQLARQDILKVLIMEGNKEVINAAVRAYSEARGNVALFLRSPVYAALVISNSSYTQELVTKLEESHSYDEVLRLVSALNLSNDPKLLDSISYRFDGSRSEAMLDYQRAIRGKASRLDLLLQSERVMGN